MVRGIANSKIGFGDLILLLRYFFKLKVSTHPNFAIQNYIDMLSYMDGGEDQYKKLMDTLAMNQTNFEYRLQAD